MAPGAEIAVRTVAAAGGVVLILTALLSALRTLVLPRSAPSTVVRIVFVSLRRLFEWRTPASRPYAERDRLLAYFAPVGLLCLPVVWVSMVAVGFTPLLWLAGVAPLKEAAITSGSSILTLGFARPEHTPAVVLCFVEAGAGLGLVTLLLSYLPSIYAAFARRETQVALLETRAGSPPSASELFRRHQAIGGLEGLSELWPVWQTWFADVEESHSTISALVFFRSPQPDRSWITAAGAVLDCAALRLSALDLPRDPRAALCIRSGFLALRHISDFYSMPYEPNPQRGDAISITRAEFDAVFDELAAAGLPMRTDRDLAWLDFAGWRVNYDHVLVALAGLTVAPWAPWSSDRAAPYRRPPLTGWGRRRAASS
jgi:hypothetical protein